MFRLGLRSRLRWTLYKNARGTVLLLQKNNTMRVRGLGPHSRPFTGVRGVQTSGKNKKTPKTKCGAGRVRTVKTNCTTRAQSRSFPSSPGTHPLGKQRKNKQKNKTTSLEDFVVGTTLGKTKKTSLRDFGVGKALRKTKKNKFRGF